MQTFSDWRTNQSDVSDGITCICTFFTYIYIQLQNTSQLTSQILCNWCIGHVVCIFCNFSKRRDSTRLLGWWCRWSNWNVAYSRLQKGYFSREPLDHTNPYMPMATQHCELSHFSGSLHPSWECDAPLATPPGATLTVKHPFLHCILPSKLKHVKYVISCYVVDTQYILYKCYIFSRCLSYKFLSLKYARVSIHTYMCVLECEMRAKMGLKCAALWTRKCCKISFLNNPVSTLWQWQRYWWRRQQS